MEAISANLPAREAHRTSRGCALRFRSLLSTVFLPAARSPARRAAIQPGKLGKPRLQVALQSGDPEAPLLPAASERDCVSSWILRPPKPRRTAPATLREPPNFFEFSAFAQGCSHLHRGIPKKSAADREAGRQPLDDLDRALDSEQFGIRVPDQVKAGASNSGDSFDKLAAGN